MATTCPEGPLPCIYGWCSLPLAWSLEVSILGVDVVGSSRTRLLPRYPFFSHPPSLLMPPCRLFRCCICVIYVVYHVFSIVEYISSLPSSFMCATLALGQPQQILYNVILEYWCLPPVSNRLHSRLALEALQLREKLQTLHYPCKLCIAVIVAL